MVYIKIRNKIIPIVIIIFILISVFCYYKIINNQTAKNSITADEVINLSSYIPYISVNIEPYTDAYNGKFITSQELLPIIVSSAFMNTHINSYTLDNIEKMEKKNNIKKYEGIKAYIDGNIFSNDEIQKFLFQHYNIKFNILEEAIDSAQTINISDNYSAFVLNNIKTISTISKILLSLEQHSTKSSLVLTEKAIFYIFKDNKYYVYKNTNINNQENLLKVYDNVDEYGNVLSFSDIYDKIKEDYKDYNYGFKHTFKKNKRDYYYYSTEMIKVK